MVVCLRELCSPYVTDLLLVRAALVRRLREDIIKVPGIDLTVGGREERD